MRRLPDGSKNRKFPEKPANRRLFGCDPDESRRPWCKGCTGSTEDTYTCRSRALRYMASLSQKEKEIVLETYGDCMCPDIYR
jgi:hypothetical protein